MILNDTATFCTVFYFLCFQLLYACYHTHSAMYTAIWFLFCTHKFIYKKVLTNNIFIVKLQHKQWGLSNKGIKAMSKSKLKITGQRISASSDTRDFYYVAYAEDEKGEEYTVYKHIESSAVEDVANPYCDNWSTIDEVYNKKGFKLNATDFYIA